MSTTVTIIRPGITITAKHTTVRIERINLDGDIFEHERKCDDIDLTVISEGQEHIFQNPFFIAEQGSELLKIGDMRMSGEMRTLCLRTDAADVAPLLDMVRARQQRKAAADAVSLESARKADEERNRRIAKGWCPRCETYCFGECTAN